MLRASFSCGWRTSLLGCWVFFPHPLFLLAFSGGNPDVRGWSLLGGFGVMLGRELQPKAGHRGRNPTRFIPTVPVS